MSSRNFCSLFSSLFDNRVLHPCLTVVLISISCFVHCSYSSCNELDLHSLSSFQLYISTASPLNWSVSVNCCIWEGVGCDHSGRITSLWLPSRGLAGTISPSIANLTTLSQLNLSHNRLSGSLPDGIFSSLNRIRVIDLSRNQLSGELPLSDKLGVAIQTFNLSSNYFHGTIKSSFLQPALNLERFDVSNNSFFGSIPSIICSFSPLTQRLDFSNNDFSGLIPQGFSLCSNLESLRAGFNNFSGEVPQDIYGLLTLQELNLPGNKLTGSIDERVVQLTNLRILALFGNDLTGMIPQYIGRLSNLERLELYENQLNGSIPSSLTNCTKLRTLTLRRNFLEGELSAFDFSKFFQLQSVDLMANSFAGGLPVSLFSCKTLVAIRLSNNKLHGEILPNILELQSLSFLSLSYNNLTNITSALRILQRLKNLSVLILSKTFHGEELPGNKNFIDYNALQNLKILSLRSNGFTGGFPKWVSKLANLEALDMSHNNIRGSIPGWIGDLPNLFLFDVSHNQLSGCFPMQLLRLQRLSSNQNSDEVKNTSFGLPLFYYFNNASNLQYTQLSNIPPTVGLGSNNFTGTIPVEIGQIKFIRGLNLSGNNFYGSIPDTISNLTNLEKLDLSGNHLSGRIPESLRNLHFLSSFIVANNNLEGPVPTGWQFDTYPSSSFESNPGLCGPILQRSCNHNRPAHKEDEEPKNEIINWLSFGIGYALSLILTEIAILKYFTYRCHSTRYSR